MRYRADPPEQRRTIASEGVTLIYHRPSGMTHVVAAPMPEILTALSLGPADLTTLAARLPTDWELDAESGPLLEARLAELIAVGLASRA